MIRALALAFAAAVLAAPGLAAEEIKLSVVATSSDLKSLVEAVGGERVEVESLADPRQDPHAIEVKPMQLARLRRAALLVRIGLDHEPWLARMAPGGDTLVVDASGGARLLQTETPRLRLERKAHVHAYGNTHYWLDPGNAQPITAAILQALVKLRPAERALFETNRSAFLLRLGEKMREWDAALKPYRGAKIVVIHDSWTYFADRFGLQIVAAAEPSPGVPPSPAELAALFRRMREGQVRVVVADPHANPALVRQIADRGGARAVVLAPSVGADPAAKDYFSLFDVNVVRLAEVLKGG